MSYLKGLSSWRFWYVIASHSTLSGCSKYRMSQNVLVTLGQILIVEQKGVIVLPNMEARGAEMDVTLLVDLYF